MSSVWTRRCKFVVFLSFSLYFASQRIFFFRYTYSYVRAQVRNAEGYALGRISIRDCQRVCPCFNQTAEVVSAEDVAAAERAESSPLENNWRSFSNLPSLDEGRQKSRKFAKVSEGDASMSFTKASRGEEQASKTFTKAKA